jgi:hypothetical protein
MEILSPLVRFQDTLVKLRQRVPVYNELHERISDADAEALLARVPDPSSLNIGRFSAELSFAELAILCRVTCLPDAAEHRDRWEPVIRLRSGKTLYLQLRSMMQFHPDNVNLRYAFTLVATDILANPSFMGRILGLLKTRHDDFFGIGSENPVDVLTEILIRNNALIGIYATDQSLVRHSPLFRQMRERFFQFCSLGGFSLNAHELFQCLDLAEQDVRSRILAHFLDAHTEKTFPTALTHELVERYGAPDESTVWDAAEFIRLEARKKKPGAGTIKGKANAPSAPADGLAGLIFWHRLETMKEHFGDNSLKMVVYSQFMHHLNKITRDEDHGAMLMHFQSFTVIDFRSVEYFSWLCEKAALELRYDSMVGSMLNQGEEEPNLRRRKKIPEAKDFIIYQQNDTAIRIAFAEVGKLYAIDLLSIQLGLMKREIWGAV